MRVGVVGVAGERVAQASRLCCHAGDFRTQREAPMYHIEPTTPSPAAPRTKKVRVPDLIPMKERGERLAMLTAYDATMASLFDRAGVDLLLVGDSLGHVILGLDSTIPITLEDIIHHARAVTRGARRALVVADMPFLTYQVSPE